MPALRASKREIVCFRATPAAMQRIIAVGDRLLLDPLLILLRLFDFLLANFISLAHDQTPFVFPPRQTRSREQAWLAVRMTSKQTVTKASAQSTRRRGRSMPRI
jgi:hypothetical protein